MDHNDLNKAWEINPLKKDRGEDARKALEKGSMTRTTRHEKRQMESQSPVCFWRIHPVNPAYAGLNIGGSEVKLRSRRPNNEWHFFPYEQILDTCRMSFATMSMALILLDFTTFLMKFDWENNFLVLECGELMAKGITGTGQEFDLPGRWLGGFSGQLPLSSLRPSALAATDNREQHDTLLPSDPKRAGGDGITRPSLAQYKLLPWPLKGDYTMTCGASPSPQIVSFLLKELLDILKAQIFR